MIQLEAEGITMSYTTLYYITPSGRVVDHAEFRNSWRSAHMVWSNLYKVYLPERIEKTKKEMGFEPHGPVTDDDYKALWPLWKQNDIPKYNRAVLASTFDRVILEKEKFQQFFDDVLEYADQFAAGTLIKQAQKILELRKKNIIGVCWNQSSVSEGCWYAGNINKVNHWFLYKELEEANDPAS
jgi:hypothetical protein